MKPKSRLYIVVDGSLPAGLKVSQAIHAAREFQRLFPEEEARWYGASNTVAVLETRDRLKLHDLFDSAVVQDVHVACFFEPDLEGTLTAIALAPGDASARLCRGLPLALS